MTCSRMSLHFPQWASISPPSCGFLLIPRIDLGFMVAVLLVRSQGVEGSGGFLSGQSSWSGQRSGRWIYRQFSRTDIDNNGHSTAGTRRVTRGLARVVPSRRIFPPTRVRQSGLRSLTPPERETRKRREGETE